MSSATPNPRLRLRTPRPVKRVPPDLHGSVLDKRYKLVERVASHDQASRYRARHLPTERLVEVEVLDPGAGRGASRRFLQQARVAGRISTHVNLALLSDCGRTPDGCLYVAIETICAPTLRAVLSHLGALPWRRACRIAVQIAAGLGALHQGGLLHNNLKPASLRVGDVHGYPDLVQLTDFRRATLSSGPVPAPSATRILEVAPGYAAPELLLGRAAETASDVYSLGVVLFEMLQGRRPFRARDCAALAMKHVHRAAPFVCAPSRMPRLPTELVDLVDSLLSKAPRRRPRTLEAMARLRALL